MIQIKRNKLSLPLDNGSGVEFYQMGISRRDALDVGNLYKPPEHKKFPTIFGIKTLKLKKEINP